MLIFFDTEFTDIGLDPKLISIGLISESEKEFYAELSDTYEPSACQPFVRDVVLPHLQGKDALMTMDELTLRLGNWIESFDQPVQLVTDSPSWDWPWIEKLFHLPGTWPQNLGAHPVPLYQIDDPDKLKQYIDWTFETQGSRLRRHHTLDDAIAHQQAWLMCKVNGDESWLHEPAMQERLARADQWMRENPVKDQVQK